MLFTVWMHSIFNRSFFKTKSLFIGSSIVTAAGYFAFAIYCYFWLHHPEFKWMPLLCFAWIVFFSSFGLMAIPYTLAAEIFPVKVLKLKQWTIVLFIECELNQLMSIVSLHLQIRGACISIALCLMWTIIYVYETIFPNLINCMGLSGCMTMFGVMSVLCTIFGIIFIPNTRGKSHEEIMQILAK